MRPERGANASGKRLRRGGGPPVRGVAARAGTGTTLWHATALARLVCGRASVSLAPDLGACKPLALRGNLGYTRRTNR
jgi:hypothetical protein